MLLAVFDDLIEEIQAHFFFDAAVDAPGNEFTGDTFTARLHDKIVDSLAMRLNAVDPIGDLQKKLIVQIGEIDIPVWEYAGYAARRAIADLKRGNLIHSFNMERERTNGCIRACQHRFVGGTAQIAMQDQIPRQIR